MKIDISKTILKTNRLILRPFKEDDLNDLFNYAKQEGVGEMAGWPHHEHLKDSAFFLHHYIDDKDTFAIEINNTVVGSISIGDLQFTPKKEDRFKRCVEVGYVLSKDLWGKGLMSEALSEVIKWLFKENDIDIIFSGHFKNNHRSYRVQLKCGFKHYLFQKYRTKRQTIEEEEIMALRREDSFIASDTFKKEMI